MRMPDMMPARLRASDLHLLPAALAMTAASDGGLLQQADWLKCAACCAGKAGFGACVATCIATGQACDGGLNNCTPC